MKGAGILFTDGEKVLVIKRAMGNHKNKWDFPGGGLKIGETALEGAKREAREEVGKVVGTRFAQLNGKFTTFLFKIDKPFEVRLSKEHSDWKWADLRKVKDLHPEIAKNIDFYVKTIEKKFKKTFKEWFFKKMDDS